MNQKSIWATRDQSCLFRYDYSLFCQYDRFHYSGRHVRRLITGVRAEKTLFEAILSPGSQTCRSARIISVLISVNN